MPNPLPRSTTSCLLRGARAWVLIAVAEMLHGVARNIFLVPRVGDLASRQIGVFTGSLIILAIACATIRWIRPSDQRELRAVGAMWLGLMLAFEVSLGRAFGMSWDRILSDYEPWRGGFMVVGMTVIACAPTLAARLRGVTVAPACDGRPPRREHR